MFYKKICEQIGPKSACLGHLKAQILNARCQPWCCLCPGLPKKLWQLHCKSMSASRKSSEFVEMFSSTVVENFARFIEGSITSLTSLPTFVFPARGFRFGNLFADK